MGFILKYMVPTNVAAKSAVLIQNCHGFCDGVEKLSDVMSSSVAAPSSPTTAGRNPMKTDCTTEVFMYFINILLIRIIRMSDGSTRANVAVMLPSMAIGGTVDADGSGGHLAYGHDVGKLARCHPVPMVHHFALYERQHTVTSTETEKSDEEECYEKL